MNINFILLHQIDNAIAGLLHNIALALYHLGEVCFWFIDFNAVLFECVRGIVKMFC